VDIALYGSANSAVEMETVACDSSVYSNLMIFIYKLLTDAPFLGEVMLELYSLLYRVSRFMGSPSSMPSPYAIMNDEGSEALDRSEGSGENVSSARTNAGMYHGFLFVYFDAIHSLS
jgi:hypothetical protein